MSQPRFPSQAPHARLRRVAQGNFPQAVTTSSPLITPHNLHALVAEEDVRTVDCRYSLQNRQQGLERYLTAHIPGAVYADLDRLPSLARGKRRGS
jgi:3-mercaptopyruvate sulfurtransferase SseA